MVVQRWGKIWLHLLPVTLVLAAALVLSSGTRAAAADAGWQTVDGAWYYFDDSGEMRTGWVKYDGSWYYFDPTTGAMQTGWITQNGATAYLQSSGVMATGWLKLDGVWYYFDSNGDMRTGWVKAGGVWYYLDPATGEMQTGWITQNGATAYLKENGAMATGWLKLDGVWYYFESDGDMRTGWLRYNGAWYYLDPETGAMWSGGWKTIQGEEVYLLSSGAAATGWVKSGGAWYYFNGEGEIQTGWVKTNGTWYYLDPDTYEMRTGWLYLDDGIYHLRSSGAMTTGWLKAAGEWYYFNGSGRMVTGWQDIDNDTYYFYKENDPNGGEYGAAAISTVIDGTVIKSGGEAVTEIEIGMKEKAQRKDSATYYLLLVDTAHCKTGVFHWSGSEWTLWYYWNCAPGKPSTPTVKGTFKVQSKGYYFDSGDARCYYYTQFYGNYLFHTVLHYHDGSMMDSRVGMQLSHGCVRLADSNAKWIYDHIPAGTTVYIY